MNELLVLPWKRQPSGYRIEEREDLPPDPGLKNTFMEDVFTPGGSFIVPNDAPTEGYLLAWPYGGTNRDALACLELANTKESRKGALDFAKRWGLLRRGRDARLDEFFDARKEIRNLLHFVRFKGLESLSGKLSRNALGSRAQEEISIVEGELLLIRQPVDLLSFCRREVFALIVTGKEFRDCDWCGRVYVGRRKTGNRTGNQEPRFCSDKCRVAQNRYEKIA